MNAPGNDLKGEHVNGTSSANLRISFQIWVIRSIADDSDWVDDSFVGDDSSDDWRSRVCRYWLFGDSRLWCWLLKNVGVLFGVGGDAWVISEFDEAFILIDDRLCFM